MSVRLLYHCEHPAQGTPGIMLMTNNAGMWRKGQCELSVGKVQDITSPAARGCDTVWRHTHRREQLGGGRQLSWCWNGACMFK